MEQARHIPPPGGLCPVHCCGWYGNVIALRALMQRGVLINYPDMYGNTALHYAVYNGHDDFVKACIDEFEANLLVVNNGNQSVLTVINQGKLDLVPNENWTVEWATNEGLEAARKTSEGEDAKSAKA